MATKVSPVALKADAWQRGPAGGDITVPCSGGTSVTLRREDPFVYVRPALHGVWPDEAQLTAAQLRTLAARLEELAEAIDPGGFASADEAVAELERAAGGECRPLSESPAFPPTTPGAIAGALLDGASEEGLALNGADVSDTNIDICELHETPAGKGPWRKVLLAGKFPPEQVRVLKAAGIETVGALADYVASGKDVLAIRGVNEGLDRLIVGCLRYHWRREVMNDLEAPLPAWLEPAARQEKAPKKRKGVKK